MPALLHIRPGKPLPLGAAPDSQGVQFAVFSRHATAVHLLLFRRPEDAAPYREIELDPALHRTGDIWHAWVEGLAPGALYLYRAFGPYRPEEGHRYNPHKLLLDPYARAVTGSFTWNLADARGFDPASPDGDLSFSTVDDGAGMPKCIVVDDGFDWQGDRPLNRPLRTSVIYETHVRGLTMHPSSAGLGVRHPGTFRGVIEMIPYFRDLGVTALELLPVQEFDELENPRLNPLTGERLANYWGYSTISFFAPKGRYSASGALGQQVTEFKEMVRELHRAGIEVILDMVFNHTAEGDQTGPTLCFRGWDNSIYYILDENRRFYRNFTGCGNTFNCNHPIVRSFILDCLHYWVIEMHVDGFRFDLGSVMGRDAQGRMLENPPVLERIAEAPILRGTKIIAEAWDAAGAYQVGSFPGGRWAEWNDRYRDDTRRYWRGEAGTVPKLATRLAGSSDLYLRDGRKPFHSINFVTSHDGFTLNDLVSYSRKHNEANGQEGRDGSDHNLSANYGVEGPTGDPRIEAVRNRQVKNFLATLLLSLGTPMILGGDEIRRTQRGNNNAWCQNNEISWYDWGRLAEHAGIHRFCRALIGFRRRHPVFLRPDFLQGVSRTGDGPPDVAWFDERGRPVDWERAGYTLACLLGGAAAGDEEHDFLLLFNSGAADQPFALAPPFRRGKWHLAIDTGLDSPRDARPPGRETPLEPPNRYPVQSRSLVVLLSR
jgi:glycogen operon protein